MTDTLLGTMLFFGPATSRFFLTKCSSAQCICACHLQVIDDSSTDSLLLVMEFVEGGSLEAAYDRASRRWDPVPEATVLRLFRELLKVPVCLGAPRLELSSSWLC